LELRCSSSSSSSKQ
jgi:hypothetical protein